MLKEFNIAKVNIECEAQSHRILNCYVRYMIRKFKLCNYDQSIFITCSKYNNYIFHVNGLLLKAREYSFYKNKIFEYSPTNCREIDILVKRFVFRFYKIKVIYTRFFRAEGNIVLKPFNLTLFSILRGIFFDLRTRASNRNNIENQAIDNKKPKVLLIGHELSTSKKAYNNLSKKLSIHFKNSKMNTKLILPFHLGLTIKDKIKNSFYILKKIFSTFSYSKFLKLSDLDFIIFQTYRKIYKKKLINYFQNNNISLIISSYINPEYESIYYEAAKALKIQYYNFDYSIGYPVKDRTFLRYLPDTRKYSDIIFSSSEFRSDQYFMSSGFLNKKPLILNHMCPQYDYSLNKKLVKKIDISEMKIGIVDNTIYDDCSLNYDDISSLIKTLKKYYYKKNINYILQSKNGDLEKEFKKLNFNNRNYISGFKGDFSLLKQSDLIISIGWQSIALKAASAFNRPLIFYSRLEYPYKEYIFSLNPNKNIVLNELCCALWMSKNDFGKKFNILLNDKKDLRNIKKISNQFLKEVNFYKGDIQDYFNKYFKS